MGKGEDERKKEEEMVDWEERKSRRRRRRNGQHKPLADPASSIRESRLIYHHFAVNRSDGLGTTAHS